MFSRSTLRGRLSLAYSATTMLSLCIFAITSIVAIDFVQRRSLDTELVAVASAQRTTVDFSAQGALDPPDRERFDFAAGPRVASAIVAPDGRIVESSKSSIPRSVVRSAMTADRSFTATIVEGGESFRATFEPISYAGRHVATVAAWNDADAIVTLDRDLALAFGAVIPLFGIATAVACNAIARTILAPLEQIISDASAIDEHDGPQRVTLPRTTELFRLATTLNRMLSRLSDAFARERRFTGDASHELRAPLAIILAEADLALAMERSPTEYRRALETIAVEADGLESLTRTLLSRARAEAASLAQPTAVDLAEVASSVVERVRRLAAARKLSIRASLTADATTIGDADEIEQALLTVVHNAVKYAAVGGSIVVTLDVRDAENALNVTDDGPGFTIDALAHAYDRFWTGSDRDGRATGHGLGLTLARAIVERYHGTISLANGPNGGGIVTISFPRAATSIANRR